MMRPRISIGRSVRQSVRYNKRKQLVPNRFHQHHLIKLWRHCSTPANSTYQKLVSTSMTVVNSSWKFERWNKLKNLICFAVGLHSRSHQEEEGTVCRWGRLDRAHQHFPRGKFPVGAIFNRSVKLRLRVSWTWYSSQNFACVFGPVSFCLLVILNDDNDDSNTKQNSK